MTQRHSSLLQFSTLKAQATGSCKSKNGSNQSNLSRAASCSAAVRRHGSIVLSYNCSRPYLGLITFHVRGGQRFKTFLILQQSYNLHFAAATLLHIVDTGIL